MLIEEYGGYILNEYIYTKGEFTYMNSIKHKPLKCILDRDEAINKSKLLIDYWSPYLEELCNYASNLLIRCEKSLKGIGGTPSSLILLYYHIIQIADGITVTCSNSCFTATIPMLRSLWEGVLSIEYILQDDFPDRSTAWMVCRHVESKSFLESLDPSTERGKAIHSIKKKDKIHFQIDIEKMAKNVSSGIHDVNKKLEKEKFKKVLEKLTKVDNKLMKWYSINNGPTSFEQLAHRLGKPLEYEFLYRYFSKLSHAQSVGHIFTTDQTGHYISQMRNSSNAETIYMITTNYLILATKSIAKKLRPEEEKIDDEVMEIIKRHRANKISS